MSFKETNSIYFNRDWAILTIVEQFTGKHLSRKLVKLAYIYQLYEPLDTSSSPPLFVVKKSNELTSFLLIYVRKKEEM